ncbi:MAG: 3-hydroxyacyl-CoA dehydrogenase family protein [Candidatus Marinimicrobia bacterium]|nr:3-hydroxyacyl-CoA dehydrogenase family protein [Candidatus Neomarinimicrobiota bacterium]
MAGYDVSLHSRTEESLRKGMNDIKADLQRLVDFGMATRDQTESAFTKIRTNVALDKAVEDTDVVIEAVYEDVALKRRIFGQLDKLCPDRTILASSTSTIMPSALAPATNRPDKVVVAHYTGPAYLSPLVEVVRAEATSDETVEAIYGLLTKVGKQPVVVQKEVPGFIANRLQTALAREALSLVQKGVASPQDVDTVIKTGLSRRWVVSGDFKLVEIIAGWDLALAIIPDVLADMDYSIDVLELVREKVERGAKTGKGFYNWTPESAEAARQKMARAFIEIEKWSQPGH